MKNGKISLMSQSSLVLEIKRRIDEAYELYKEQQKSLQDMMEVIPATDIKCIRAAIEMAKQEGKIETLETILRTIKEWS